MNISRPSNLLDEFREVVLLDQNDVGHEIVMIDLDLQPLGNLIEAISDWIFRVHHHSYYHAYLFLKVHPVGDKRFEPFASFFLFQHSHEDVGQSYQGGRVLEYLFVIGVVSDVGNADIVHRYQVISFNDVFGFIHDDPLCSFVFINFRFKLFFVQIKYLVGLPEAINSMVGQWFEGYLFFGRRFQDRSEDVEIVGRHQGVREIYLFLEGGKDNIMDFEFFGCRIYIVL